MYDDDFLGDFDPGLCKCSRHGVIFDWWEPCPQCLAEAEKIEELSLSLTRQNAAETKADRRHARQTIVILRRLYE